MIINNMKLNYTKIDIEVTDILRHKYGIDDEMTLSAGEVSECVTFVVEEILKDIDKFYLKKEENECKSGKHFQYTIKD